MHFGEVVVWTSQHRQFPCQVVTEGLRRATQGERVAVVQLLKGGIGQGSHSPIRLVERLEWLRPNIARVIDSEANLEEQQAVQALWARVIEIVGALNLLVIEEVGLAVRFGLIEEEQLLQLLMNKPRALEVVLTGPAVPGSIIPFADRWTATRSPELGQVAVHQPPLVTAGG